MKHSSNKTIFNKYYFKRSLNLFYKTISYYLIVVVEIIHFVRIIHSINITKEKKMISCRSDKCGHFRQVTFMERLYKRIHELSSP